MEEISFSEKAYQSQNNCMPQSLAFWQSWENMEWSFFLFVAKITQEADNLTAINRHAQQDSAGMLNLYIMQSVCNLLNQARTIHGQVAIVNACQTSEQHALIFHWSCSQSFEWVKLYMQIFIRIDRGKENKKKMIITFTVVSYSREQKKMKTEVCPEADSSLFLMS